MTSVVARRYDAPPVGRDQKLNADAILIRVAEVQDHGAIIDLAREALGWRREDPNAEMFRWKHLDNPFGPSPMWVAVDGQRLAGFRTLLRWEFDDPVLGLQRAARAVDTATHPDYQGRGLFTALTRRALEMLEADGVDFIFNTPNAASRAGYLKMGWVDVGRVPVAVALRSPASPPRLLRARAPAEKWSLPTAAGEDALDVFSDLGAIPDLLGDQPRSPGLRTRRSAAFFKWRYASGPLRYRVMLVGNGLEAGFAVFRLRRRGAAVEAVLCDVLVPDADVRLERALTRAVMRDARPDYLIRVQQAPMTRALSVRLPRQGPRLTWRALNRTSPPPLRGWDLRLGDVELF